MTLFNPFGVDRYLHPRRSGMIAYGNIFSDWVQGDTPAPQITNVGLQEDQMGILTGNQTELGEGQVALGEGQVTLGSGQDAIIAGQGLLGQDNVSLDLGQQGIMNQIGNPGGVAGYYEDNIANQSVGRVGDPYYDSATGLYAGQAANQFNTNQKFTDLNTLLGENTNAINTRFNTLDTNLGTPTTGIMGDVAGLQSSVTTGFGDQTTGFNDVNTRFDTVDSDLGTLQGDVTTGFGNQTTGFADAQTNRIALNDAAILDRTTKQTDNLAGQTLAGGKLDALKTNADIADIAILQGQTDAAGVRDGFVSNFDKYIDNYTDNEALAVQARSDIKLADTNQADAITTAVNTAAGNQTTQLDNIGLGIGANKTAAQGLADDLATGFTSRFDTQDSGFQQRGLDLTGAFDAQGKLFDGMDTQFTTTGDLLGGLATDFDDQGKLITDSVDINGNTVKRAFNDNRDIVVKTFNEQGGILNERQIKIEETMGTEGTRIRTAIGEQGDTLIQEFDATGKLIGENQTIITAAVDASGKETRTSLDLQGNMIVDTFDAQGELISSENYTVQQSIDAQGNTLTNLFDTQGTLITNTADAAQIVRTRDAARALADTEGLSAQVKDQFDQISAAFDDTGNLITQSVDAQGFLTRRQIGSQGELLLSTYDVQGALMSERAVDIQSALGEIQNMQNIQANNRNNARINSLSPSGSQLGGFASPYANTRS